MADEPVSSTSFNAVGDEVSQWSELPSLALENIYSFLGRKDQIQMALVCRRWLEEYSAPSIWRNIKFDLSGYDYYSLHPEIQWTQNYGHMFRHVEISCRDVRLPLQEEIYQQLKLFLQSLTCHSQLSTLSFINMDVYFQSLDEIIFEDIYISILNLILVQSKLTSIKFQNAAFKTHNALGMLRMICYKHRTLKNLNLERFVTESSQDLTINIVDVRPYYETLMNLQEMTVDYSQIFENVISSVFDYATSLGPEQRKGHLEKLKVICNGSISVNYQGIPSAAWKYFRKAFPALRIDFLFYNGPYFLNSFDVFFVRYMPVRLLNIKWYQQSDERDVNDIGSLFQYIASCETTDFLEDLSIMWPHNSRNLARDLIIFLRVCNRLQILQLHVEHPVDELDAVLKWWFENGPKSLEVAQITIANVPTSEDIENYTNVADEYAPLLQVLGLNFILIVDSE